MRKASSTNNHNRKALETMCPMFYAMQLLNGRWKVLILWYISLGANRFGLLKQNIPAITTKMLSQQLRELEADGLLIRTIFAEMPPRVEYTLTAKTTSLIPALEALNNWGKKEKKKDLRTLAEK